MQVLKINHMVTVVVAHLQEFENTWRENKTEGNELRWRNWRKMLFNESFKGKRNKLLFYFFTFSLLSKTGHRCRGGLGVSGQKLAQTGTETTSEWREAGVHLQETSYRAGGDGGGAAEGVEEESRSGGQNRGSDQSPEGLSVKADRWKGGGRT